MSNDCGCGPMSLILSAALPMTDLLKIAAMHCLALPSAICCSSRLKYSGIHRRRTNFCAHPTSLDGGQTRSTRRGSFLSRGIEPPKLICIKDKSNNPHPPLRLHGYRLPRHVDLIRSRAALQAEIWVLRQQINVLRRTASKKLSLPSTN